MVLKTGDASDKKNLWARKLRDPAARMTTSASSAQKTVDSGTEVSLVSIVPAGSMAEGNN